MSAVTCNVCGKTFKCAEYLARHERYHDVPPTQWPHECPICFKKFLYKKLLTRHCQKHQGDVNLCSTCGKTFSRADYLKLHIKMKHVKVGGIVCDVCGELFQTKVHLDGHKIAKHGVEKTLKCEKCGKLFAYKKNLVYHVSKVCDKVRPEVEKKQCKTCSQYFATSKRLKQHSRLHQDPTFVCSICGRRFRWKSGLRVHSVTCKL